MSGDELRDMMRDREDAFATELAGTEPGDSGRARVLTSAAANRRRSVWGRAAVAAVGVTVIGLGAWALAGSRHETPPASPPTAQPTAQPTAPSAEPEDLTFPAPLPADGFFLESQRLTQAVWGTVGDGWTLTYWQPSRQAYGDAGHDVTDPETAAVYLMSPQGERYEVGHFDAPADAVISQIAWWTPDSLEAIVEVWRDDETTWQWLDLSTGGIDPLGGLPPDAGLVGWTPYETLLFQMDDGIVSLAPDATQTPILADGYGALLSPDGTILVDVERDDMEAPTVITAYATKTGSVEWTFDVGTVRGEAATICEVDGWATPREPAVVCQDFDGPDNALVAGPATIYSVSDAGASMIFEDASNTHWWGVQVAADGVIAVGADPMAQGLGPTYYIDREPLTRWSDPSRDSQWAHVRSVGGAEIATWSSGDNYQSTSARDAERGLAFDVTPPLENDPDWWWTTSAAVFLVGGTGSPN